MNTSVVYDAAPDVSGMKRRMRPQNRTVYEVLPILEMQDKQLWGHTLNCKVVQEDCLDIAFRLRMMNPCVLNMADADNFGGGVANGAAAQVTMHVQTCVVCEC